MIYLHIILFVLTFICFIFIIGSTWYSTLYLINSWREEDGKIVKRLAGKVVLTAIIVIIMGSALVGVTRKMVSFYNCLF